MFSVSPWYTATDTYVCSFANQPWQRERPSSFRMRSVTNNIIYAAALSSDVTVPAGEDTRIMVKEGHEYESKNFFIAWGGNLPMCWSPRWPVTQASLTSSIYRTRTAFPCASLGIPEAFSACGSSKPPLILPPSLPETTNHRKTPR